MLFVIDKPKFQRAISIVRDDRKKRSQGLAGPFMRLEAKDDHVKIDGVEASAKIPATVYEPGVLFLKVTLLRRLLQTIKGEEFLTIQVMADGVLIGHARLPLESNEMLLYTDPTTAPQKHPSVSLTEPAEPRTESKDRQLMLWDETENEKKRDGISDQ
jgi:hypothetical protein